MKTRDVSFSVLLDAGVPDSVGEVFRERKHKVILHRDILLEKTPDIAVCKAALANNAVLVGIDRDMKLYPQKYGVSTKSDRFPGLSLIRLCLPEPKAANRLRQTLNLVEHEWLFTVQKSARRLWIDIEQHRITTYR